MSSSWHVVEITGWVWHVKRLFSLATHLAALAGDDPVVNPTGLVRAHLARDDLDLG
jgi:hypothetical protein